MSCEYTTRGAFCSRPCHSCDRRMKWRAIDARIMRQRSTARQMSTRPNGGTK